LPAGQVVAGEKALLRAHEGIDRSGDEAAVPRIPCAGDLLLASTASGLFEDALVRRGDAGAAKERARFRRRQKDLRRAWPLAPEHALDLADDPCDRGDHRTAILRESDRDLRP